MKKIYILLFLSFFPVLFVSAKVVSPRISNTFKYSFKEDLEKEKIEGASEETGETGELKTKEFIHSQFIRIVFF